jgi:hypothetical protein
MPLSRGENIGLREKPGWLNSQGDKTLTCRSKGFLLGETMVVLCFWMDNRVCGDWIEDTQRLENLRDNEQ